MPGLIRIGVMNLVRAHRRGVEKDRAGGDVWDIGVRHGLGGEGCEGFWQRRELRVDDGGERGRGARNDATCMVADAAFGVIGVLQATHIDDERC